MVRQTIDWRSLVVPVKYSERRRHLWRLLLHSSLFFDGESFINEYYGAWSGTDEDRILSYYAENVVLQILGTLMEGKEALRDQFVRPFITAFPGNRHLVKNMIFAPGVGIVEFDFQARHQGPFAGHAATGARVNVPGCGVYEYD